MHYEVSRIFFFPVGIEKTNKASPSTQKEFLTVKAGTEIQGVEGISWILISQTPKQNLLRASA